MNRLAWLVCLVFLLACSGSLVTAYGAAVAIPDWPKTFGHWIYPPHWWLGRLDGVFLNQLHRTLAQFALLGAAGLAVVVWRSEARPQVRMLGLAVVVGVLVQSVLGGWRVMSDSVPVAAIHAATAPLVVALCLAVAVVPGKCSLAGEPARSLHHAKALHRWCLAALSLAYLLIFVDAQIRHVPPTAGLSWLPFWVSSKLPLTVLAVVAAGRLMMLAWRRFGDRPAVVHRIGWFVGLLATQLLLGGGAWVTQYGWPPWFADYVLPISYTVTAGGPLQGAVTASHIIAGPLVTAAGVNAAVATYGVVPKGRQ